jgi:RHS repeat-associated protein
MPDTQYTQRAKKVQMYYDPRGQVVRTVNPDATEQWVLFGKPQNITSVTLNELGLPVPSSPPSQGGVPAGGGGQGGATPWESYTFDANDLAPRTHPSGSGVPATHHWTPSSSLLDPLGRTIRTIDRNGATQADEVLMQYQFDIRGNLLKVTDALDRTAFTHVYDLKPKAGEEDQGANILKTTHIDSGTKTALFDAAHRPTELRDAKGALILHGHDQLNRPTRIWARDNASENVTLRQKLIYGDDASDGPPTPTYTNHLGKLYQHYDEAGLVTLEEYDFKGNILQKKRGVIADSEIEAVFNGPPTDWEVPVYRVDWDSSPAMEGEYVTDMEYDALNRMKKMVYPEDEDTERKELIPTYNNAGALEKVTMDGDTYVEHIAYNAKGQRLLIAFGNDVMTRYTYDPNTFRLSRMKSEKYTRNGWTFEYDSGTTKNDIAYRYDLAGNIVQMIDKTPAAAKGPNDLTRNFSYDPLYRLLSATGRECDNPTPSPPWDDTPRCTDPTATRNYERRYTYDLMGNILQLKHLAAGGNFNRDFNYAITTNNHLNSIDASSTNYASQYDANGNMTKENSNRNFEWDHSDQLRAFYDQAGTGQPSIYEHYLYDASGNRIKKITRKDSGSHPFEVTMYIDGIYEKSYKWDGSSGYAEEKNELHIMDDKSRIAMKWVGFDDDTAEVKYILDNHLGSSNVILEDDAGATVYNREEYFPFGETSFGSFGKKRYRYVGKEKDEYSGLYYYGARYYSAWTCRFISTDPLFRDYAFYTPYQYAGNKPIIAIDIDGLEDAQVTEPVNETNGQSGNTSQNSDFGEMPLSVPIEGAEFPTDMNAESSASTEGGAQSTESELPETFPQVGPSIWKKDFVRWGEGSRNCNDLSRRQLAKVGYQASGENNSIQVAIQDSAQMTPTETSIEGINNLYSQVKQGKPVMVGVDRNLEQSNDNSDRSTEHFIVVIGMGNDADGNYFLFYDNAASVVLNGTSDSNKLYVKNDGLVQGTSNAYIDKDRIVNYTLTQVRKSWK